MSNDARTSPEKNMLPARAAGTDGGPEEGTEVALTDAEFRQALLQHQSEYAPSSKPDMLEDRWRIDLNRPMPEYDSGLGVAYEVIDERQERTNLYGVLAPTHLGLRTQATEAIQSISHPNLVALRAAGSVRLSNPREGRFLIVFETPKGQTLSALLARQGAFSERFVIDQVITPVCEILSALQERGINHGRLNLDNIYYGDKLTVGECVSEPSGYSQPNLYEPPERILSQPLGKGSAEVNADCYALGIIALILLSGRIPAIANDRTGYLRQIMQNGTYTTLTQYQHFSPVITDFLRGVLNDNRMDRWGVAQVREWIAGKRYNLIPPSQPRDASRSFPFHGQDFVNCRALAFAFHEAWDEAVEEIKNGKMLRWAQLSLNKTEMKEMLDKIISRAANNRNNRKADNEALARAIIALDPSGPIRMRGLSANIDGLGAVLADAFFRNNAEHLAYLHELIENDLPNFWSDQHKSLQNQEISAMLWRLQKVRMLMRNKALGFGMERVLYELNPTMACQSGLLKGEHVTNAMDLLMALDRLSKEMGPGHLPLDRHAAAFLTAKLNINKEITAQEVGPFSDLVREPKLLVLKLLAIAQEKNNHVSLKGVANWAALASFPLVERYRNRRIREAVYREVSHAARTGQVSGIYRALTNTIYLANDRTEFKRAQNLFRVNNQRIRAISDERYLNDQARSVGRTAARWTGYATLIVTLFVLMQGM